MESALSGNNHIKTVKKAKKLGYKIIILYIFVDNPEICLDRIRIRVLNGGHDVPAEDVKRRFTRSKINFWNIYKNISDEWILFYNGGKQVFPVAKNSDIINEELFSKFLESVK
ncbi:MAG: hypothetical protein LBI01_06695 [Elusimicrobium sp.]|nr:hypothetical protein [Elusimicrobium sp.]